MNKKVAVFAAAIAALALMCQGASAQSAKPIDPRVSAASFWNGAAWTGVYFAIDAKHTGVGTGAAWGLTTMGCMAVSPMVATVVLNRPLKFREAHILIGSCLVPIIGGWLVNEAYNAHILWAPDEQPAKKVRSAKKK
jgi:hypothetical protein